MQLWAFPAIQKFEWLTFLMKTINTKSQKEKVYDIP
jgi:hypothetical protein